LHRASLPLGNTKPTDSVAIQTLDHSSASGAVRLGGPPAHPPTSVSRTGGRSSSATSPPTPAGPRPAAR